MKPQSYEIRKPITKIFISPPSDPVTGESVKIIGDSPVISLGITTSGIVKGNFKSPNNWSYNVVNRFIWDGEMDVVEYDFFGNPATIYTLKGPLTGGYPGNVPEWERNSIYNEGLSKLNEKVRGGLDLSVDIAEAGKTRKMLAETLKAERWFGSFGTKRWANEWLQFTYGWKPLLSSIYGAADESLRYVNNRIERFRVRHRRPFSRYESQSQAGFYGSGRMPTVVTPKGFQGCEFNIRMKVKDFDLARWTSLNPLSIAWELTPYSFVADWFIDIGSFLRDYETSLLYRTAFQGGYVSEIYSVRAWEELSKMSETLYSGVKPFRTSNFRSMSAFTKEIHFVRTVLTSYPGPRLPGFKADLGWRRLLSAGALLRQRFR